MTYEQIQNILEKKHSSGGVFDIRFKTRNSIKGLFIKTADYAELSRKNLWRIVSERNIDEYKKTRNESLSRIFNGTEFTGLAANS
jgi:hypothetical protein